MKTKMKNELKDSIEFLGINIGGIGLSLTDVDSLLRILILLCTLIYSILKIRRYIENGKREK
tara:strand:- start:176 stop:361 length:186 start_codon:yes stop_codon:yes gene_type:complete